MAADRARRFMASLQTTSDEALQRVQEDVRDLVRSYPTRVRNPSRRRDCASWVSVGRGCVNNLALQALVAAVAADKAIVDERAARAAVAEVTAE